MFIGTYCWPLTRLMLILAAIPIGVAVAAKHLHFNRGLACGLTIVLLVLTVWIQILVDRRKGNASNKTEPANKSEQT
ncbi:MAG: hypothetical protein WCI03_08765 [bacterium]